MKHRFDRLAAVLALGLLGTSTAAQTSVEPNGPAEPNLPPCVQGDDNFGLGCCTEPAPSYPNFPAVSSIGKYACIADCGVAEEHLVNVTLGAPNFILCDVATIEVSVTPALAPGVPSMTGRVFAKYSRTWQLLEGVPKQVWRFVLNGDLRYTGVDAAQTPCPVPPAGNALSSVADFSVLEHFVGHVDYVCDPEQQHVTLLLDSFSLSHLPGCISHAPGTKRQRSGAAAHYRFSYHVVAPSNFTFTTPASAPGGFVAGESVRAASVGDCFPSSYSCVGEATVEGGEYFFSNCDVCVCSSFPCTGPWRHYGMAVPVNCNGATQIMTGAPGVWPAAPEGLVGLGLGSWGNGSGPLGTTDLFVKFGALQAARPCFDQGQRTHTVYGVATRSVDGSEPTLFSNGAVVDFFIDLQNSLTVSKATGLVAATPVTSGPGGPIPIPVPICFKLKTGFGAPAYSDLVIQLNN